MAGSINAPVISEARLDFSALAKGERCRLWFLCWESSVSERLMPRLDTCFASFEDRGTLLSWATCCQRVQRRRDLRGPCISSWRGTLPPAPPKCLRGTLLGVRPATRLCSSAGWWWTAALLCRDASLWLTLPGRIQISLHRSFSLLLWRLGLKKNTQESCGTGIYVTTHHKANFVAAWDIRPPHPEFVLMLTLLATIIITIIKEVVCLLCGSIKRCLCLWGCLDLR